MGEDYPVIWQPKEKPMTAHTEQGYPTSAEYDRYKRRNRRLDLVAKVLFGAFLGAVGMWTWLQLT